MLRSCCPGCFGFCHIVILCRTQAGATGGGLLLCQAQGQDHDQGATTTSGPTLGLRHALVLLRVASHGRDHDRVGATPAAARAKPIADQITIAVGGGIAAEAAEGGTV